VLPQAAADANRDETVGSLRSSRTASNPNSWRATVVWSRISTSVFEIRRMPRLRDPSASEIPARKPLRHADDGADGQAVKLPMRATDAAEDVRMAVTARRFSVAAEKLNQSVVTPSCAR
jgi:hypothetical protein